MARRRVDFSNAANVEYRAIISESSRQFGEEQSIAYEIKIRNTLHTLADQPQLGRSREEIAPGLRSFPVGSHTVFYLTSDDRLLVAHILHTRQSEELTNWKPKV